MIGEGKCWDRDIKMSISSSSKMVSTTAKISKRFRRIKLKL